MLKSILIYASGFATSCFFARKYEKSKKRGLRKALILFCVVFPPIIISGFRYGVGIDYNSYVEIFYQVKASVNFSNIFSFYLEPLWTLINLISPTSRGVFVISSCIYTITITYAIWRMREKIGFCFPLFISYMCFYSLSFNGVRQAIACAIVLLGLSFYKEKKWIYIGFVILAALFHKSALVMLFALLLKGRKAQLKAVYMLVIILSVAMPYVVTAIEKIVNALGIYGSYLSKEANISHGFLLYTIPVILGTQYLITKYKIYDSTVIILFCLYLLQIPFQFVGNHIAYADRISEYGLITQVFFVPYICNLIKGKISSEYKALFCLWYIVHYVVMYIVLNAGGVYPYFMEVI